MVERPSDFVDPATPQAGTRGERVERQSGVPIVARVVAAVGNATLLRCAVLEVAHGSVVSEETWHVIWIFGIV